ncbi:uncharacterized protein LOC126843038 isoform X3 [Adelges cooleyi]|uniref:uncharacterized protein LOC126843038 isoform X3 n=1 Tax=Adelges cooleyi TaxID=133065 RepID=UPI00217F5DF0|nr:uncharacterized protein LOC126843038 isoform X3 [Adelges cooleyi]
MQKIAYILTAVIILETILVTQGRPYPNGDDSKKTEDPKGVFKSKKDGSSAYVFKSEDPKGGECSCSFNSDDNELEHQRVKLGGKCSNEKELKRKVKRCVFRHCCNCFLGCVRCCCCPICTCAEAMPDKW